MGDDPCHIQSDPTGKYLVITNYSSGSFIVYELNNHIPIKVHSFIVHEGKGNNPDRQAGPHPHTTLFSTDGNILFVADLGTDWIYYYRF
jgi:6-phosphogluconolactonase